MASRLTARDVDVSNATPTLICSASRHRGSLVIHNGGPNAIYLGPSDVTTDTGLPLAAGATFTSDPAIGEAIYAIAATAAQTGTANTRVLETYGN